MLFTHAVVPVMKAQTSGTGNQQTLPVSAPPNLDAANKIPEAGPEVR
jgi:hypothetical protein